METKSQNLVPNESFEDGIECPIFIADLHDRCDQWYRSVEIPGLEDWEQPSPDWFHECSSQDLLTPPNTVYGFQEPYEGEGFAGIAFSNMGPGNLREIIGVELLTPLEIGSEYEVSFKVSRLFNSFNTLACNNIGFRFSGTGLFNSIESVVDNFSHFKVDSILTDTTNWATVSAHFVADSAYVFLHIGNFYDDLSTTFIGNSDSTSLSFAYYVIDAVSVMLASPNSVVERGIDSELLVYPNPTNDRISVSSGSIIHLTKVLDMRGNTILSQQHHQSEIEFFLDELESGVYILLIETSEGIYREKILKEYYEF